MQVLSLKLNEYPNINNSIQKRNTLNQTLKTSYPMTQNQIYFNPAYCVSFSGACVDLSKAMKTLKATEILKDDTRLPKRVEDLANSILRKGNTQNLTLIDVHKQAYFDIMYAKSLEEVRAKFPEFSKILSVTELEQTPQKGSFLREILDGKNEYFNKDNDITLQLMKMYWGEGFSLSDLEKHMGIKSTTFSSVMRILNIPLRSKHYASVLKHSDPEASKRIAAMTAATKNANFEKANGYVSIPKGHLPIEMSHKILDSLFDYYEKDPIRIYEQPKIVKNFYKDNILAEEIFRGALFEVWGFPSMKNIKSNMLNFFDKKAAMNGRHEKAQKYSISDLCGYHQLSSEEIAWMKEFLSNKKDKDTFSRSLRSAYKHVKSRLEDEINKKSGLVLYPKRIQDIVYRYYDELGRDRSEFIPNLLQSRETRSYSIPICGRISIFNLLARNDKIDQAYTNSLFDTFVFTLKLLEKERAKDCRKVYKDIDNLLDEAAIFGISSNTAMNAYMSICNNLLKAKRQDLVTKISSYFEYNSKCDLDVKNIPLNL